MDGSSQHPAQYSLTILIKQMLYSKFSNPYQLYLGEEVPSLNPHCSLSCVSIVWGFDRGVANQFQF